MTVLLEVLKLVIIFGFLSGGKFNSRIYLEVFAYEEKFPCRITGEGCSTIASALKSLLFSITMFVYVVHSEVCIMCRFFFLSIRTAAVISCSE